MQGSYILLAAIGIFILIGGAKRITKSFKLGAVAMAVVIIAVILGNTIPAFTALGWAFNIGSIVLAAACLVFFFRCTGREMLMMVVSMAVVSGFLLLYQTQVADRLGVGTMANAVMLASFAAIGSFLLTRGSGQAFVVTVISMFGFDIMLSLIYGNAVFFGNETIFSLTIFAAVGAVILHEFVDVCVAAFRERKPEMRFEAGEEHDEENDRFGDNEERISQYDQEGRNSYRKDYNDYKDDWRDR